MTRPRWFIYFFAIFCLLSYTDLVAANELAVLQKTTFEEDENSFRVYLHFDRPANVEASSIELINQTIQINLPQASVKATKSSQKIENSEIGSLYIYQYQPDLLRARVIFKTQLASQFRDQVRLATKGQVTEIKIEKRRSSVSLDEGLYPPQRLSDEAEFENELLSFGQTSTKPIKNEVDSIPEKAGSDAVKSADSSLAESEIPVALSKKKVQEKESNLWLRLLWSLGVLAMMAGALILFGRKFSKQKLKVGGSVKIEVMAQHSLGPKKHLTVISVAGEALLIGVTDHRISLIKSLALIDDELPELKATSFQSELEASKGVSRSQTSISQVSQARVLQEPRKTEQKSHLDDELFKIKDRIASRLKEMRPL